MPGETINTLHLIKTDKIHYNKTDIYKYFILFTHISKQNCAQREAVRRLSTVPKSKNKFNLLIFFELSFYHRYISISMVFTRVSFAYSANVMVNGSFVGLTRGLAGSDLRVKTGSGSYLIFT